MISNCAELQNLELPAPMLRPAFHHNLCLRVELYPVSALCVEIAEKAFVPAAEWEEGHWCRHANVYTDVAGVNLMTELARNRAAAREKAGHVPVSADASIIDQSNRVLNRIRVHQAENRAENLRTRDLASRLHRVQHRWKHPVAIVVSRHLLLSPIHQHTRPLLGPVLESDPQCAAYSPA